MSATYDIPNLINREPVRAYQWAIFVLSFLTTLFDGFDTQAIGYTGPAIIAAFGLRPSELAPILIAGTLGMTVGAMTLGLLGDRVGRRPALLGGVAIFSVATLLTAFAKSTSLVLVLRFIAGLGMGGCTPVLLALAAEFWPARHRGAVMTGVLLGLPAGAMVGAFLASKMMPVLGWQSVFIAGGAAPLCLLVVLFFVLPESLSFSVSQAQGTATQSVRKLLSKVLRIDVPADAVFAVPLTASRASVHALFGDGKTRNTVAIWCVYFCNWVAWFMFLSWLPTVLKATGLPAAQAPMGTVTVNAVFIVCAVPLSLLLPRVSTRLILVVLMAMGIALSVGLSVSGESWTFVFLLVGAAGLGIGGQQIVLNYLTVEAYPTTLRATATGWAIGMGRLGAIFGSAIGGRVLEVGGPAGFYAALAVPLLVALLSVGLIRSANSGESKDFAPVH